eukprot:1824842-Prymnesium_polylepis.1
MCLTALCPHRPALTPAHSTEAITVVATLYALGALRRTAASQVSLNPNLCDADPGSTTFIHHVLTRIMTNASTSDLTPHDFVSSPGVVSDSSSSAPSGVPPVSAAFSSAHAARTSSSVAGSAS